MNENNSQSIQDERQQAIASLNVVEDAEIATGDFRGVSEQICRLCDRVALIPGLDGYFCRYCGWVEERSLAELAALGKKSKKGK